MPAQPVTITEDEMRRVLTGGKRPPTFMQANDGQLVASWEVTKNGRPTGLVVKVYTSIFAGVSRGVGEDSIRVCVVDSVTGKGVSKTAWTQRTEGWSNRLIAKVREMFELAVTIPRCAACGRPMAKREGTHGPFLGCIGFPSCKATRKI